MNDLRIGWWKGAAATAAGWAVYLPVSLLFRLPDALLAAFFRALYPLVKLAAGESPASRAVADLGFVFARGGDGAAVFRRILTRARPEELVMIVRGAVIRSLP